MSDAVHGGLDREGIVRARALLRGVVSQTPVELSRALSALVGGPVYLKCENLQRTGSFKIRGAYVRMARLTAAERARGVVAASAGNHAQGVALAAQLLGIAAVVYMPIDAALPKIAATRQYGAEVLLRGSSVDEALAEARAEADRSGRVLIHPFDHADIVAGQGTIGLEILEAVPDVRTILVPTGGGGLLAGIALAVDGGGPRRAVDFADAEPGRAVDGVGPAGGVRVVGIQAAGAAAYPASLAAGHPVALAHLSTMADGIAVGTPGAIPFAVIRDRVDRVVTVSEEELARGVLAVAERAKMIVEPSGGAGVGAILGDPTAFDPPVVVVLSGGNIDPLVLLGVVRRGLSVAGRYLHMWVRIPDRPGALAALLARLAASGGNVVSIAHVRTSADLVIGEVEVEVQLETKGSEHCGQVLADLHGAGYHVRQS